MRAARLMGVETEYALAGLGPGGVRMPESVVLSWLMEGAKARLAHLPDTTAAGLFLENGSRFYADTGHHPEVSTPECVDPADVVTYVRAGDEILRRLAAHLERSHGDLERVLLSRSNVDYSDNGSTWGCHESYMCAQVACSLPDQIIPHLVSRIIFTGAGGLDAVTGAARFVLSPRAMHITRVISTTSTNERGIFHVKDEPLCTGGFQRVHVICGESLCSETADWLRLGTTALVLALVEGGASPGDAVSLDCPLSALRAFAQDPDCRATVSLASGRPITALAIQRHYLGQVEARLHLSTMPSWAAAVCRTWREVLDQLGRDPLALHATLDWPMKLMLLRRHATRRRVDWGRLQAWSAAVGRACSEDLPDSDRPKPFQGLAWLNVENRAAVLRRLLDNCGDERGAALENHAVLLRLRDELCEIDASFSRVGDGLFAALDRAGVLRHRVVEPRVVLAALSSAPDSTRAALRGELVRRLAASPRQLVCTWEAVHDLGEGRVADLSDPFAREERWRVAKEAERLPIMQRHSLLAMLAARDL